MFDSAIIDTLIWSVVLPAAFIFAFQKCIVVAHNYIKTLWVVGNPNEWVLIMNNGEMVRAAVGLRCFRGPFD